LLVHFVQKHEGMKSIFDLTKSLAHVAVLCGFSSHFSLLLQYNHSHLIWILVQSCCIPSTLPCAGMKGKTYSNEFQFISQSGMLISLITFFVIFVGSLLYSWFLVPLKCEIWSRGMFQSFCHLYYFILNSFSFLRQSHFINQEFFTYIFYVAWQLILVHFKNVHVWYSPFNRYYILNAVNASSMGRIKTINFRFVSSLSS